MIRLLLCLCLVFITGCSSAYYGAWEKFGVYKRDILVKRVAASKESQEEAKEEFSSALDEFIAVTKIDSGKLESQYRKVEAAYTDAEDAAQEVRDRNNETDRVAKALFKEWDKEIDSFESTELKLESRRQFRTSKQRYEELIKTMRRAERRLDPVLRQFRDQTLFLKHNLNARAIAALQPKAARITSDVNRLIADMNRSIAEAESFIASMKE